MFRCSISAFLVIFVSYVVSNDGNNNRKISTNLIAENGSTYTCPYTKQVVLRDGENVTVVMTHTNHINIAYVQLPSVSKLYITDGDYYRKTRKFQISPENTGNWSFSTLSNKGASEVNDQNLRKIIHENETYYEFRCDYNILVQKSQGDGPKKDENWIYYVIGGSVLAIIIVIQTIVILYILKTKKLRRIEQLALSNNTRSGSDTARYSALPARKPSVKPNPDEDAGSIYESLDAIQTPANDAPPPPPIDTLPRPPKKDKVPLLPKNSSEVSTLTPPRKPPITEEKNRIRPQMPLPSDIESASARMEEPFLPPNNGPVTLPRTESNISVTVRGPVKSKMPAFVPAEIPPSPDRAAPKMTRKPSALNQDPIANELNNILKKRQTGNITPKPHKPLDVPEPIPETKPKPPFLTSQGLRPPTMSKPTTPVTPAKLPPPVAPKNIPGLPRSPIQQPLLSPKPAPARKWPPINSSGTQPHPTPLHPNYPHGNPLQSQAHPMPQQHPVPGTQKPPLVLPPRTVPVLPADVPEEEPEYAEYAEDADDDDDEEWTYEPLTPYNIYSS